MVHLQGGRLAKTMYWASGLCISWFKRYYIYTWTDLSLSWRPAQVLSATSAVSFQRRPKTTRRRNQTCHDLRAKTFLHHLVLLKTRRITKAPFKFDVQYYAKTASFLVSNIQSVVHAAFCCDCSKWRHVPGGWLATNELRRSKRRIKASPPTSLRLASSLALRLIP